VDVQSNVTLDRILAATGVPLSANRLTFDTNI
jgi:hypothetical protein